MNAVHCLVSFSYLGGCCCLWVHCFHMRAVVFVHGRLSCGGGGGSLPWPVLVFGCHVAVSDVAPGFPVSKESGGRGVFTHLGWVDVPRCHRCVASIWPALVHLVMWRCRVVLVVLGHSVVGWLTRVRRLGLSVLVVIVASDVALPCCRWSFLLWIAVGGGRCWWQWQWGDVVARWWWVGVVDDGGGGWGRKGVDICWRPNR